MKTLAAALLLTATTASASITVVDTKIPCASTKDLSAIITGEYSEHIVFLGRGESNTVISVALNSDTGSFTVIETYKDVSCVLAAGDLAQHIKLPGRGEF